MLIGSGIIFITNADTNFPLDELILNLSIKQLGKFLINFVSFYLHKWRIQENYFHKDRVACVVCVAPVPIHLYYKSDFYKDALMQIVPPLTRAHCTK